LLIAGGLCFGIFVYGIDFREFLWLQKISVERLICIVGINAMVLILKAWRWRYLLSQFGIRLGNGKLFSAVSAGMYMGLVSPGTSGEFGRIVTVPVKSSLGFVTIALEKFTDFGVLFLISVAGIMYWVNPDRGGLLAGFLCAVIFCLLAMSFKRVEMRLLPWVERLWKRISKKEFTGRELFAFLGRKDTLFVSMGVSFLLWVIPGVQYYLICDGIQNGIGVESIVISLYMPYLAGVLSMIPFGLGVFEIGASQLLGRISGDQEAIGASLLLFRLLTTLPLVLFGLACFVRIALRRDGGEG